MIQDLPWLAKKGAIFAPERKLPRSLCAVSPPHPYSRPGLALDPVSPFGATNYCIDTSIQFYRPDLTPVGHNVRLSPHTWDPQLSSPRPECICGGGSFIGDYFGVDSRAGFTYTTSVETYNAAGENPGYHQQQLVSRLRTP